MSINCSSLSVLTTRVKPRVAASYKYFAGSLMLVSILNLLWEYSQPEHSSGRCVAMRRTGRLFVHQCDSPLPFMCKVSADNIQYNEECNTFDPRKFMCHQPVQ